MKSFHSATVAILLATASTASAEDAASLQKNLQAYLGSEPGVVTVTPAGDDFQITLDIMPYITKGQIPDTKVSLTPLVVTAHANGDGTWNIKSTAPLNMSVESPALTMKYDGGTLNWTGTFDEELRGFTKSHAEMDGASLTETLVDPSTDVKTNIAYSFGKYTIDTTATKREAGVADFVSKVEVDNIKGTWATEGSNSPMAGGSFAANKVGAQADAKGFHQRATMDLLAWFVSHPSKDLVVKDQADLKKALLAAMPIFESANVNESFEALDIQTPIGSFTAQSAKIGIDMAGFVKDGRFGESIGVSGLAIPPGIAPPWSADLIPTSFDVGFSASGFDADASAKIFIDKMDISKAEPISPDVSPALMAAAVPNGTINISLPTTTITAPIYSISMTANVEMPMSKPMTGPAFKSAKLDIKMTGFDAVMAKLQEVAKTDPQASQAIAVAIGAKGMAKSEADGSLSWAIVQTADGNVSINGLNLGAIAPPAQ
jgi:hypothetical protein